MQSGKSWGFFLKALGTEYAKGTSDLYVRALDGFINYLKTDGEGLYQLYLNSEKSEDIRDKGEIVREAKAYMKKLIDDGYSVSASQQVRKALTVFMHSNGFESFSIKQRLGYIPHKGAEMVSKDDLRKMVELAPNYRSKGLIYFLKESGMRIGDALALNVGDIIKGFDEKTLYYMINIIQIKTRRPSKTIIGTEAISALKRMVEERRIEGETITNSSPLFVDAQTGKRLGRTAGTELMRRAGEKANLTKVSAHSLRKFAITGMQVGKINPNHIALIVGKVAAGSWGEYTKPTDEQLINDYMGAYSNIAIHEKGENIGLLTEYSKRIEDLENKYATVEKPYVSTVEKLYTQMAEMQKEIDSMRKANELKDQEELMLKKDTA